MLAEPGPQLGDARIALADVGGDPVQQFVHRAHVVPPQRERESDTRHVAAGHGTFQRQVERRMVGFEAPQLPAVPHDHHGHDDKHREGGQCGQDQDGCHGFDRATFQAPANWRGHPGAACDTRDVPNEIFMVVGPEETVPDVSDAGHRPSAARVRSLVAEGRPVLVRCAPGRHEPEDLPESLALVSVYAWLGARVFATGHPAEVRQALDMVAAIQGRRPPAVARRGLA